MTGGGSKPDAPKPIPPAQIQVAAPEASDKTVQKRRRGYLSTILAGGMNQRNEILKTDKLG